MKKLGVIGVGKMGLSHLAIANQTVGIEVAAICDTSKPLLRFLEKNTKFRAFSDYKKMIDDVQLDGIMVNVPNTFHFEIAKYCLEKGISVFVEKPFTLTYKESQELVELAKAKNLKGQVGYVNRFNPIFQRVKKLLDEKVLGEIASYSNRMVGGVVIAESSKGWRNDYSKGGGCLFDYGPHCFDLSTYFFGTDVRIVSSVLKKVFSTMVDDIVSATLLHDDKIVGYNYINWSDNSVRKASNTIEIFGSKGKIIANKQELSIYMNEADEGNNLQKGWNQLYITDENTDVNYYLRGEDFSRQLEEFSQLLNGTISESRSSLYSASITDKMLEETFNLSGGVR
ncbi:MAG: Gfo/Idh/MocA family oxidoreductase [Sulfuricurvum sp.]|jgi:predicted dehydrogenase|uniref:Gfo/Idh/MocA family protein n=1 Tax=Sulfuricurvum sp. TaxID=2025608 RepID=UPI0026000FA9|nr:Gfo/Idh/MocA family oxidoreductase [Sulfuricurvum sp.]MCK9372285.1 Gfo/Idh/MocA family oxidoreductase [Sulfuricurvum sp.]